MLFQKLEDCFIEVCVQNCFDYEKGQKPSMWAEACEESLLKLQAELDKSIDSAPKGYLLSEARRYYDFKPSLRLEFLRKRFLTRYTDPSPDFPIPAKSKELLEEQWTSFTESRIFNTCLEVYSQHFEMLYKTLIAVTAPDTQLDKVDPLKLPDNESFKSLFISSVHYDTLIARLKELGWINNDLKWAEHSKDRIRPMLRVLLDAKRFGTTNKSTIARYFKATFATTLSEESIRQMDKALKTESIEWVRSQLLD